MDFYSAYAHAFFNETVIERMEVKTIDMKNIITKQFVR